MKMKAIRLATLALLIVGTVGLVGCESRTERTDGGGILLSISDFDGLPISVSVNTSAGGFVQVEELQVTSIVKNLDITPSSLMNVEIDSYEVRYTRGDNGTIVPVPFVRGIFGEVPPGGTITYNNLPIMAPEQFTAKPLSDLLFQNGGFDKETGDTTIVLNFHLRFFGRTVSGDAVATEPASFTLTITP